MNPFEFVIAALILVFAFSILRHKLGIPVRSMREMRGDAPDTAETLRLKDDVKSLKQRVQVLEQIVTDAGAQTANQIEALRQPRISQEDEA